MYLSAMKPLFSLSVVLVILSCSDIKKGKQLEEIARMSKIIDSLQAQWTKEEQTKIDSFIYTCSSKIDSVATFYQGQELNINEATQIELFKNASSDFIELKKIHDFFPVILSEKKQSIQSLQQDINSGSGRREKYDQYIEFEKQELKTIIQQLNNYSQIKQRCLTNFSQSRTTIDTLIQQFNEQKRLETNG